MKKLVDVINKIPNKNNYLLCSLISLLISSIIFTLPYLHAFTTKNFLDSLLMAILFGCGVFVCILIFLSIFTQVQNSINNLFFKEVVIKIGLVLSFELIIFTALCFVLMFYPTLYLALGIILASTLCGINIFTMYYMFQERTTLKSQLFKTSKLINLITLSIVVCLWLVI